MTCSYVHWGIPCVLPLGHDGDHDPGGHDPTNPHHLPCDVCEKAS